MRDRAYERQALDAIAAAAGHSGSVADHFAEAVMERLERGGREHGGDDGFWEKGLDYCLANGAEEGEDIPGWLLGALQVLGDSEIPDESAHQIRCLLMDACADGMRAWVRIHIARQIASEHIASHEPPIPISGG